MPASDLREAAEAQARSRSAREGVACYVYRSGQTWYVRTAAEGKPEGATLEYEVFMAPAENPARLCVDCARRVAEGGLPAHGDCRYRLREVTADRHARLCETETDHHAIAFCQCDAAVLYRRLKEADADARQAKWDALLGPAE